MRMLLLVAFCFVSAVKANINDTNLHSKATVRIHHERSTDSQLEVSVGAFGEEHHLTLKKTSLPSVKLQEICISSNGTVSIHNSSNINSDSEFFEDEKSGALLFMNDRNSLEGMVSESIALKFKDDQYVASRLGKTSSKSLCGTPDLEKTSESLSAAFERVDSESRIDFYNVEVLSVIDSRLATILGSDAYIIAYLKVFWNMVNRRFYTVSGVTVRLRLAGILISRSYNTDNLLLSPLGSNHAHIDNSIYKFSKFAAVKQSSLAKHDVAYLMTGRDLSRTSSSGLVTGYLGRVLTIGYPCLVTSSYAYNVGIGEDDGNYNGMMTAAHEIGHNLGAEHDGTGGARSCSWNLGYMMAYPRINYRTFFFSSCSSSAMKAMYSSSRGTCLKSITGSYIPFIYHYPGYYTTLNDQCRQRTGHSTAEVNPSYPAYYHCVRLRCRYTVTENTQVSTYYYTSFFPALEGSRCSTGGYCFHGYCRSSSG